MLAAAQKDAARGCAVVLAEDRAHVPVMLEEVVEAAAFACAQCPPGSAPLVVDCTAGAGGHSAAILEAVPSARVVAVDRDPRMANVAARALARFGPDRALVFNAPYSSMSACVAEAARMWGAPVPAWAVQQAPPRSAAADDATPLDADADAAAAADAPSPAAPYCVSDAPQPPAGAHAPPLDARFVLLDLGLASPQLDDGTNRAGLSFRRKGPLDMRLRSRAEPAGETAAELVNLLPRPALSRLFSDLGDLPRRDADAIAAGITEWRSSGRHRRRVGTALELRLVVERAVAESTGEPAGLAAQVRRQRRRAKGAELACADVWRSAREQEADVRAVAGRRPRGPALRALQGVWQSLRVAVNEERAHLRAALSSGRRALRGALGPGASLAVIGFERHESRHVEALCRAERAVVAELDWEGARVGTGPATRTGAKGELDAALAELLEEEEDDDEDEDGEAGAAPGDDMDGSAVGGSASDDAVTGGSAGGDALPASGVALLTPSLGLRPRRSEVSLNARARSARLFLLSWPGRAGGGAGDADRAAEVRWPSTASDRGGVGRSLALRGVERARERRQVARRVRRQGAAEGGPDQRRRSEPAGAGGLAGAVAGVGSVGRAGLAVRLATRGGGGEARETVGGGGGGGRVIGQWDGMVVIDEGEGSDGLFGAQEGEVSLGWADEGLAEDATGTSAGEGSALRPAMGAMADITEVSAVGAGAGGAGDEGSDGSAGGGDDDAASLESEWASAAAERR